MRLFSQLYMQIQVHLFHFIDDMLLIIPWDCFLNIERIYDTIFNLFLQWRKQNITNLF